MIVKRKNNQSILDVCVEHTGSIETLVEIMELNSFSSLDVDQKNIEISTVLKPSVVNFFKVNNQSPATHEETGGLDYDPRDYNMNDYN